MTTVQSDQRSAVTATTVVEASQEAAFMFFTKEIGAWWSPDHHIIDAELAEMVFEPHEGGCIYDRGVDGSECRWARVLAYDPHERVVFSWDISSDWKLESDPAKASEVEVRFVAEGANRTRVQLEHRHLDRHGEGWEAHRDAVGSPAGWQAGLDHYAETLQRR